MNEEFYILQLITESERVRHILILILPIIITLILLKVDWLKLPIDRGREFAIDGIKSKGKPTGVGIILFVSFAISFSLLGNFDMKWLIFILLLFIEMLTGFLDDKALTPWNELLKGSFDLILCLFVALTFNAYSDMNLNLLLFKVSSTSIFGYMIIILFLWLCINSFNCCDGIDGLSGSLAINSMIFIAVFSIHTLTLGNQMIIISILTVILLVYLWFNSEKSSILMGDAGSRFIGLLLGILILETGNLWIAFPFAISIIVDGFPGLVKILMIKVLKKNLISIRLPLHDFMRKDQGWSNTKIVTRLNMIQAFVSILALISYGLI